MPTWFYILMGCIVLAGIIGVVVAVVVGKKVLGKADQLLKDTHRDDAVVHSKCMIRDGAIQCPGVALVADGKLIILSVFDKSHEIPLTSITVIKEGPGFGKIAWLGKRVFYLDTPQTSNLAIGVREPEPWRKTFEKKGTS